MFGRAAAASRCTCRVDVVGDRQPRVSLHPPDASGEKFEAGIISGRAPFYPLVFGGNRNHRAAPSLFFDPRDLGRLALEGLFEGVKILIKR